jgi:ribonucleoside-triphosphate reductase (thioredoxin)
VEIKRLPDQGFRRIMQLVDEHGSIVDPYRNFIALSRYSRWLEDEGRRETWTEAVDRYYNYIDRHLVKYNYTLSEELRQELRDATVNHEIMPSMRALMTAGPALERDHIAGYNCSFISVDSPRAFDEAMYILMCGTGVGFSVEEKYVSQLPVVNEHFEESSSSIVVDDSKGGWARALRELIAMLYAGQVPNWDMSHVRPAGARLKTFGGRASGPEPLDSLFKFLVRTFKEAAGRKLSTVEANDIMCMIGDVVVVGGVRRSALISLTDLTDYDMSKAKSGAWWTSAEHRRLANISAVYEEKPSVGQFLDEWSTLYESKSGERGIFNLEGNQDHASASGRRDGAKVQGTNPCGEILLRANQFCNLTEVVIDPRDTIQTLTRKVELATILGTIQSSMTNFKYIRKVWKNNCEEERLLGVSLTGQFGNSLMAGKQGKDILAAALDEMREAAIKANAEFAKSLGINPSTAITTVKPSGTVSQLTGTSSGMHPWHSQYYIRSVRADIKDPMTQMLIDHKVPHEPDLMNKERGVVFYFPVKAPEDSITRNDLSAIEHLEIWKVYKQHWTEHNPSITVNVREDEWVDVAAWVYENWESVGGISFLPYDGGNYKQAPYQEITEEGYNTLVNSFPKDIRWKDLGLYELMDSTTGSQELACVAGACDVVDLVTAKV